MGNGSSKEAQVKPLPLEGNGVKCSRFRFPWCGGGQFEELLGGWSQGGVFCAFPPLRGGIRYASVCTVLGMENTLETLKILGAHFERGSERKDCPFCSMSGNKFKGA